MKKFIDNLVKVEDFLASSKFAVSLLIFSTLYFVIATIIESLYGAGFAGIIFYQSAGMAILSILAVISIFFAIMKRLTLSKKNIAFQVMHIGILIIFAGGLFTYVSGIDGTLTLSPGELNNKVVFKDKQITFIPHDDFNKVLFFPLPDTVFSTNLNKQFNGVLFKEYLPYAEEKLLWKKEKGPLSAYIELLQDEEVVAPLVFSHSLKSRFRHETEVGPLRIYFMPQSFFSFMTTYKWGNDQVCLDVLESVPNPRSKNDIEASRRSCFDLKSLQSYPTVLVLGDKVALFNRTKNLFIDYQDFSENKRVELPWMNLVLNKVKITSDEYPTLAPVWTLPMAKDDEGKVFTAISMLFGGQQYWLYEGNEEIVKTKDGIYSVGITKKIHQLPFQVFLDKFEILKDDKGNPSSYQSNIDIYDFDGNKSSHLVSMNAPLKVGDFTLYQSSYFEIGKNTYESTLSVSYDPGRVYKYFGSLLLIIGGFLYYLFAIRPNSEFKDD